MQASTRTCTLPVAMPCESQKPAHYLQSNSENSFGSLECHRLCYLFLIAQGGFDYNRNNDAQWTDSPGDELGPTIGGTTICTTTIPLSLHTQMLVQVNYVGKWSGIWASGQQGTFLLRWEQIQRMRHGMELQNICAADGGAKMFWDWSIWCMRRGCESWDCASRRKESPEGILSTCINNWWERVEKMQPDCMWYPVTG